MYVELHAASAFSFLEAASLPETLVDRAVKLSYPALALLDRDGVYGAPRFHLAARAAGIKALIGAELTISRDSGLGIRDSGFRSPKPPIPNPKSGIQRPEAGGRKPGTHSFLSPQSSSLNSSPSVWRLPVLIESREGYRNLCRLVTHMKLRAPKGEGALALEELEGFTTGLVALAGSAVLANGRYGVGGLLDRLIGLFGRSNVYVEVQRHLLRDEESDNQALLALASAFQVPVVAANGVRFADETDRRVYDVLTCIRHRTTLDRAGTRLAPNAERYLKPPAVMERLFCDLPAAVTATEELAGRLQFTMADLGYRFPEYPVPGGGAGGSFLRKITEAGARERYRPYDERARRQIQRELDLIEKLDLAGYFLIVWDLVNFCRRQDILVQGRGSAANSAVCYSLGITAVDPIKMDLLFERFLSEERGEWPDIDLDLPSGEPRERVIQYVYERYGRHGAGMTANVVTYRGRSAAREVGKALDLDPAHLDRLAKAIDAFEWIDPQDTLERHLRESDCDLSDPRIRLFADLWRRFQHLPRHLGQHSGGMVICQGRLDEVVPLERAGMPGRVVVQWDKDDCADMGIVKVDLLGLGMMAVLQDALALVNGQTGIGIRDSGFEEPLNAATENSRIPNPESPTPTLDLAHLPPDDPAVYRMLQAADTIGVFQVESRAQMATLPRLKPERFYDLVVEVAIIRPGPIVGEMVHPYLKRRAGREPVTYPHPSLEPILKRTLGVPLFQEQLLRMAMVAAGFSGGEAEELRRAFGFKRSTERMRQIEQKLRGGMARNRIAGEAADEIVKSITSFALYGFPESHAASFALLVYASAYLKAHYPAAFYTALLNNQPMGFYHPATLVKDAQRHGVRFAPIDVERSNWVCTVEEDGRIRLGLCYMAGLRVEVGRAIESPAVSRRSSVEVGRRQSSVDGRRWLAFESRIPNPEFRFRSIEDLIARTDIHRDELATLAELGALSSFGYDRRNALWQIERAVRPAGELFMDETAAAGQHAPLVSSSSLAQRTENEERRAGNEDRLIQSSALSPQSSSLDSPLLPMTPVERMVSDYEGMGLTIGPHPMVFRRADLAMRGVLRAGDLPRARAGRRVRVAGAVITRQRPGTAKGFVFLTLEDETGIANVIVRPDLFAAHRAPIVEAPFLLVEGVLQVQDGVTSVKAERIEPLTSSGPAVESHDFY